MLPPRLNPCSNKAGLVKKKPEKEDMINHSRKKCEIVWEVREHKEGSDTDTHTCVS